MKERKIYPKDLTGQTFGRLTVLSLEQANEKMVDEIWKCQCSCDLHKIVNVKRRYLINGTTRSCGCLAKEARKLPNSGQFQAIDPTDIVGARLGKLIVLNVDHKTGRHYYYNCECDCGNTTVKERSALLNNINLQCTECYKEGLKMKAANELIGQKFGRLTVLSINKIEKKIEPNGKAHNVFYYNCKCDCGNTCVINKYYLSCSGTQSCGCLAIEAAIKSHLTHGMSGTPFYSKWGNMICRCYNVNDSSYEDYGARGIIVCPEWHTFENFRDDMYDSYLKHVEEFGETDTTLERIDVNGNYCPENCTWATLAEQNQNMRTNFRVMYNGREYIASKLYDITSPNMSYVTFNHRLHKYIDENGNEVEFSKCSDTVFEGSRIISPISFLNDNE